MHRSSSRRFPHRPALSVKICFRLFREWSRKPLTNDRRGKEMRVIRIAAACLVMQLAGCASIVSGTNQSLSVETRSDTGRYHPDLSQSRRPRDCFRSDRSDLRRAKSGRNFSQIRRQRQSAERLEVRRIRVKRRSRPSCTRIARSRQRCHRGRPSRHARKGNPSDRRHHSSHKISARRYSDKYLHESSGVPSGKHFPGRYSTPGSKCAAKSWRRSR